MTKSKAPNDKKNLERSVKLRYAIQSGQSSIHGDTNYEVQTQEAQSFAFYASTGQGASPGGGPGTGKAVLYTPGMSMEILGEGLKVRDAGDTTQLPAKIIKCKKGDLIIDCENGDITLKARNINIDAFGGGQDGQVDIDANRLLNVKSPDMRIKNDKCVLDVTQDLDVVTRGKIEFLYGMMNASSFADSKFGALTANLRKTQIGTFRTL